MSARKELREKLLQDTHYNANGYQPELRVLKRVPISDESVVLLCEFSKKDKAGRFEFAVFRDDLNGEGHYPSDKFGYGTENEANEHFYDCVGRALTEWFEGSR